MKTLSLLSLLSAPAAFALSLINLEAAISLLSVAGLVGIMAVDYSRRAHVLAVWRAPLHRFPATHGPALPDFELAA